MPNRDASVGKIQWIACRGASECEGQQSEVLMVAKIPPAGGGGTAIHYRCQKCKRRFKIRF